MTQRALEQVRQRAGTDPEFRRHLETDPRPALALYDLTVAEMTSLMGLIASGELWAADSKATAEPRPPAATSSRSSAPTQSRPSPSPEP